MPSITAGVRFGFGFGFGAAFGLAARVFFCAGLACFAAGWCLTGCSGLISLTAALGELWPRPGSMTPPPAASTATSPAAAKIRTRSVTFLLSARAGHVLTQRERARFPAPFRKPLSGVLAGARLDVTRRAGLVVEDRAGDGVLDAVQRRVRDRDLHVLDAGVIRLLQLRQGHARVARGVVGVERLHAGDGCADVCLRRGLVRPRAEAEVRRDRDCKQDPEDDDHDQELDQGETLIAAESVHKP